MARPRLPPREPIEIDFTKIDHAAIALALGIDGGGEVGAESTELADGALSLAWDGLAVAVPIRPATQKELQASVVFEARK